MLWVGGGGVSLIDIVSAAPTIIVEAAALSLSRVDANRHSLELLTSQILELMKQLAVTDTEVAATFIL